MSDRAKPLQGGWLVLAVLATSAAGLAFLNRDRISTLTALPPSQRVAAVVDPDLRDAVASPSMFPGAGGWLQTAAGLAGLSRSAHNAALLGQLPPRASWGRTVFHGNKIIEDRILPGVPEPTLGPLRRQYRYPLLTPSEAVLGVVRQSRAAQQLGRVLLLHAAPLDVNGPTSVGPKSP
jgi:hypothetical protein